MLLLLGVLLVRGREERVALCLSFLPSKICDSWEWLVTEYGYMIHSDFSLFILCHIVYSLRFSFSEVFSEPFSWDFCREDLEEFLCGICSGNHT